MNATHTLACWTAAHAAARQNGAGPVEAFDWAALWLTETGDKDCECRAGQNLLTRAQFAFARS